MTSEINNLVGELRSFWRARSVQAAFRLLEDRAADLVQVDPMTSPGGVLVGQLALWFDLGFDDHGLVEELLRRVPAGARGALPLGDYLHLRLAEARLAMRREDLTEALRHVDAVLQLKDDLDVGDLVPVALYWKAQCYRKGGEYRSALQYAVGAREAAAALGQESLAAVIRTLEAWIHFQNGENKQAVRLLQEAEAVLRAGDDVLTQGNILSAYGRIARREGRYDHALQYFERSVALFSDRQPLSRYLARTLTNMAQTKRLLAAQLRTIVEAERERRRAGRKPSSTMANTASHLERMNQLLQEALTNLDAAAAIYEHHTSSHGRGNVQVNYALIHFDAGNLDAAEEKAQGAYEAGESKADYLLMCRARILQAMIANSRFEEQISPDQHLSRYAQIAHDCAAEAVQLAEHTQNRRLLARAYLWQGWTLVNGFYNDVRAAGSCASKAEGFLVRERHDPIWEELERLKARIVQTGNTDPNLRAWSEGLVGDKTLVEITEQFEELLIPKVWEREERKVARVAKRLSVSPKKVRRILRRQGLLATAAANPSGEPTRVRLGQSPEE